MTTFDVRFRTTLQADFIGEAASLAVEAANRIGGEYPIIVNVTVLLGNGETGTTITKEVRPPNKRPVE
jgi:hypothetical protein